jgi:hypothetical protein
MSSSFSSHFTFGMFRIFVLLSNFIVQYSVGTFSGFILLFDLTIQSFFIVICSAKLWDKNSFFILGYHMGDIPQGRPSPARG